MAKSGLRHGHTANGRRTPEYSAWRSMMKRCTNPTYYAYPNYGGRGIRVCEAWMASFEAFFRDVGSRPTPKHSLDRIDNNGNYEPGNVRWATWAEQNRNKRSVRLVAIDGVTRCVSEWAEIAHIKWVTLYARLMRGWSGQRLLSPEHGGMKLSTRDVWSIWDMAHAGRAYPEIAKEFGVSLTTVSDIVTGRRRRAITAAQRSA